MDVEAFPGTYEYVSSDPLTPPRAVHIYLLLLEWGQTVFSYFLLLCLFLFVILVIFTFLLAFVSFVSLFFYLIFSLVTISPKWPFDCLSFPFFLPHFCVSRFFFFPCVSFIFFSLFLFLCRLVSHLSLFLHVVNLLSWFRLSFFKFSLFSVFLVLPLLFFLLSLVRLCSLSPSSSRGNLKFVIFYSFSSSTFTSRSWPRAIIIFISLSFSFSSLSFLSITSCRGDKGKPRTIIRIPREIYARKKNRGEST